jgi:uncharacterized protein YwqG
MEARKDDKLKLVEQATTRYYDQLSQDNRKEQQLWGDLGIANFPE